MDYKIITLIVLGILTSISGIVSCLYIYQDAETLKKKKLYKLFRKGDCPFNYVGGLEDPESHFKADHEFKKWLFIFATIFLSIFTLILMKL